MTLDLLWRIKHWQWGKITTTDFLVEYECEFCGATIVHPSRRFALWVSKGNGLSAHDAEYCPESRNHSHKPKDQVNENV